MSKKDRKIPACAFRKYGKLFGVGNIEEEYALEFSALMFLMAAAIEFHDELAKNWDDWYEGPIH